ncbi:hypothetical protein ZWY2020_003768 [Hordeum vulgare]|nr:hypothetical protein ZWY2020_003768 [Hordeum vulgare]
MAAAALLLLLLVWPTVVVSAAGCGGCTRSSRWSAATTSTGRRYPAINKPAGVVHWLEHSLEADNVDWVVFLDGDQIVRGPIIPWELGAEKGKPIAAYYGYGFSQQFRVDDPSVHFST